MNSQRGHFIELGKDLFTYGFMTGVAKLISLLLLPVFTRVFATDEYGTIDIVITVTGLLAAFTDLGLTSAIHRYYYELEDDNYRASFISTIVVCIAVVGFGLLLLGALFSNSIAQLLLSDEGKGPLILLGFTSAAITALSDIPQMILRMERRIIKFNLLNIIHSLVYAGFSLCLIFVYSFGLRGIFLALVIAASIKLCIGLAWIKTHLTRNISYSQLKYSLKYGLPLVPSVLVTWINNQVDRLMLLSFLGLGGVGVFAAAARVSGIISLVVLVFRQSWGPYSMSVMKLPTRDRDAFYLRALNYYAAGFASLGLLLVVISPEIFQVMVPIEYQAGYLIVPWLAGAAILHASGNITTVGILIAEKTISNSISAWSGAILNIVLSLALIPPFGIRGAAIGTFVATLAKTALLCYFTTRLSTVRFDIASLIIVLTGYVATSSLLLWIVSSPLLPTAFNLMVRVSITAIVLLFIFYRITDKPTRNFLQRVVINLPDYIHR